MQHMRFGLRHVITRVSYSRTIRFKVFSVGSEALPEASVEVLGSLGSRVEAQKLQALECYAPSDV